MTIYYLNETAKPSGEHELHTSNCQSLPYAINRIYLGVFHNCQEAIVKAKQEYDNVIICPLCCNKNHNPK